MQEISTLNILKCFNSVYNLNLYNKSKKISRCSSKNIKDFFKEFYKRFIIPFYIPILTLVPFLVLISSKENTNYSKIKFLTFLFGLFIIIFSETTIRLISDIYVENFIILIWQFALSLFCTFFCHF